MANKLWIGTDGDLSANANYSPANLPVNGDNLFFRSPEFGGSIVPPTTNMTALAAVALNFVHVDKEWWAGSGTPPNLGSSGTPIQISCTRFLYEGRGTLYLLEGNGTTADFECRSVNKVLAVQLTGSTFTRTQVSSGHLKLASGSFSHVHVSYVSNPSSDAILTVDAAITGPIVELMLDGGIANVSDSVNACIQSAGTLNYLAGTMTDYFGSGGTHNFLVSTTLARAFVRGSCVLDCNRNNIPKTITVAQESGGGRIIYTPGRDSITPTYIGRGSK